MIQIEKIAENLFDKIRSRFDKVNIGDESAKATLEPEKARFFNFDYVVDSKNFGNITISIVDDNNLKVFFARDIDLGMEPDEKQQWYAFLRGLRLFAKRNMISFDIRDITKSGLNIKDLQHANKDAQVVTSADVVTEARMFGTSKSSYQQLENVRIIARHSKKIMDDSIPGARGRNIEAIYIENQLGERFRLPEGTTLNGARVYARHIKNGGTMHDDFAHHIGRMISEMSNLKFFVRNMRERTFEDAKTSKMVEAAVDYYGKLHRDLFSLRGQRGYQQYKELWQPEADVDEQYDINELKDRFIKRVFDERLTDALPIVHHAYQASKNRAGEKFEEWADEMVSEDNDNDSEHSDSVFANSAKTTDSAGNAVDSDEVSGNLAELFNEFGFEWTVQDGVYYFTSQEELERAKDIIADHNPREPFPEMEVRNPMGSQTYGSSTFDLDNSRFSTGVMERADVEDLSLLKLLAGVTKK